MYDVPVVKVGHERQARGREDEAGGLAAERAALPLPQVRPELPVDDEDEEEGGVRRREVQQEALLVDRCNQERPGLTKIR